MTGNADAMLPRKLLVVAMSLVIGSGLASCGTDDTGTEGRDSGPGQSTEEDPTLTEDSDEGDPAKGSSDAGSGTGSGRGDE
jgi:hypothetical protein